MKVPASWLQEYLGREMTAVEMGEALELAGIELEQIISSNKFDKNIVVGLVKKVIQHPGADRLKLTDVSLGRAVARIVCGASNLEEGQKVAVAVPGATLPGGQTIEKTVIRGEASSGMICSAQELGISDDHEGILVLSSDFEVGAKLCDVWPNEEILDLTTAANRSDLQSVVGLAREVAAFTGADLKLPLSEADSDKGKGQVDFKVEAKDQVKRYMIQKFQVDQQYGTAEWAKSRLAASGIRPINLVVDITNYVMLEFGQPMHAFDAAKVKLPIVVRMARAGEKLTTLDRVERTLGGKDLVIADASGPIALAGVMGGVSTEVTAETAEILIESAVFDGPTIRQMASRHGLRTEASARFERRLPVELAAVGLDRVATVLHQAAGAKPISGVNDSLKVIPKPRTVSIQPEEVNSRLGLDVSEKEMVKYLESLGFEVKTGTSWIVTVPWWRPDVTILEDIIEEVVRVVGYDKLPATLPSWRPTRVNFDLYYAKLWQTKAALRDLGWFEVVTYSFVSQKQLENCGRDPKEHLKLKNPLSIEQAYLRSDLLPSLLSTVAKNVHQREQFGLFEVSRVYRPKADHSQLPDEPTDLGITTYGQGGYESVKAALDLLSRELGVAVSVKPQEVSGLHPSRSAVLELDGKSLGQIGEVHPDITRKYKLKERVGYLELDFKRLLAAAKGHKYRPISRFPAISRDLAMIISEDVLWSEVEGEIAKLGVAEAEFLSDYRGKDIPDGKKSLAVRLTMSSMERTLTDKEADAGAEKVRAALKKTFGAEPRG